MGVCDICVPLRDTCILLLPMGSLPCQLRNELKIIQIEKEKSEELTQAKLRYFTNISHDFLTPITIISCLIDDMVMTYKIEFPSWIK